MREVFDKARFGELPMTQTGFKATRYSHLIEQLRERPNEWAVIAHTGDGGLTAAIKSGALGFTPKGAFDSKSRRLADGRKEVWARYVGADNGDL